MPISEISTYCRICEPQCALRAQVDTDTEEVIRLLPDKNHPVHKGFACHKGLNFTELHTDPDRINYPLSRVNDKSAEPEFERLSWADATRQIAERIGELKDRYGSDALGFYIGNPSAFNSSGRDAARRFARAMGARYMFGSGTQDCSNKFAASEVVYGTANLHPIPDFRHTRFFLSLGSNPRVSHVSFVHMTDPMDALRGIVKRGGRVVHVNPRQIESATPATGEVLQIKPDTDVFLLAALIHTLFAEELTHRDSLEQHASNIRGLRQFVDRYPASRVAAVVGIEAEEIRDLARAFASADGASVHMSTGVNMGRSGTLAYWLVQMLSLVTGNLGREGGNIYSPGYFPAATVGKPKQQDPFFESEFGSIRRITGSLPGNLMADHIEAGLVKGLIVMSGNPILSMAGETRLQQALAGLDFMLVIDIYPSATSAYADYVLPATDWLERADINSVSLGFQPEPYVQYTAPVVEPKYERKPEWRIFGELLQALGLPSILDQDDPDPLARLDRQLAHSDSAEHPLSMDALKSAPSGTITLPLPEPELLFELGVQHEQHKVDCFPALMEQGSDACEALFKELEGEPRDLLKLITLRTNYMVNSWMHNLPALKRDHALDNPLHMHPDDISERNLKSGVEVQVKTEYGTIIATVRADATLRPGVVAMTHGWGHGGNRRLSVASNHPGTNVNAILPTGPGSFDPLSNMSFMTGVPVEVSQVA